MDYVNTTLVQVDHTYNDKARITWGYFEDDEKIDSVEKARNHSINPIAGKSCSVDFSKFDKTPEPMEYYRVQESKIRDGAYEADEDAEFVRVPEEEKVLNQYAKEEMADLNF